MLDTRPLLLVTDFPCIQRNTLKTVQVNLGYKCNLSCTHCHVNAGPARTELMTKEIIDLVLDFIHRHPVETLDLTGGAPELNRYFKYLVKEARKTGIEVIDRCNLTILQEPGFENMVEFLAEQGVTVTASLPCYIEQNVAKQRGKNVYWESIAALKRLNSVGYGIDKDKLLNLVFNLL